MNRRMICVAATVLWATATLFAAGADPGGLGSPDEKVRLETSAALAAGKADSVPALAAALDGDNPAAAKMAGITLLAIVEKSAGTPDGAAVAAAFGKELGARRAPAKNEICRMLGYLPGAESATVLGAALADKDAQEMARWALCRNPDPKATVILVEALKQTKQMETFEEFLGKLKQGAKITYADAFKPQPMMLEQPN